MTDYTMKNPVLFIGLNVLLVVGLSVIQVVAANSISTTGIQLGKVEQQIADLKKQNAILREQVLGLSSLNTIASRASEMGFEEAKSPLVITAPLPLARR